LCNSSGGQRDDLLAPHVLGRLVPDELGKGRDPNLTVQFRGFGWRFARYAGDRFA
jgi:hypothetical protein